MPIVRLRVGRLNSRDLARAVPEVKDFDNAAISIYPIVDVQRRVQKPPHASAYPCTGTPLRRKTPQEIDVIQERRSEPFRGRRMVRPRPGHDGLEVYDRRAIRIVKSTQESFSGLHPEKRYGLGRRPLCRARSLRQFRRKPRPVPRSKRTDRPVSLTNGRPDLFKAQPTKRNQPGATNQAQPNRRIQPGASN